MTFSAVKRKKEMAFLLSKVSVAFMLSVMSCLAVYCATGDNKTAKQPSSSVVQYVVLYCIQI